MYKTILVHVDGGPGQDGRLRAAVRLASEHEAHLVGAASTGISWTDLALLAGSIEPPVPLADLGTVREAARQHLDAFLEQARRLGADRLETRLVEDATPYSLLLQSRYADLLVLSQETDGRRPQAGDARRLPEHLALHGIRPVLVVPDSYGGAPIAGMVLVGWDGSMQALRAIDASLPLLCEADAVQLVLVNPDTLSGLHGDEPGADMALYLARHGVPVEVVVERTAAPVGQALAGIARSAGAGLIVAGAYGHSRFREWVLGGATRELLERAPVPLLIAH